MSKVHHNQDSSYYYRGTHISLDHQFLHIFPVRIFYVCTHLDILHLMNLCTYIHFYRPLLEHILGFLCRFYHSSYTSLVDHHKGIYKILCQFLHP